jgi:hypothetical protein
MGVFVTDAVLRHRSRAKTMGTAGQARAVRHGRSGAAVRLDVEGEIAFGVAFEHERRFGG